MADSFLCLEGLKLIFYGRFGTKIRKILSKNISIEIHFHFVLIFKMDVSLKGCVTHTKSCAVGLCCPSAAQYPKNSYVKVPSLRQLVLKRLMFNPPNCRIAGYTGPSAVQSHLIEKLSAFLFGWLRIFKSLLRKRGSIRKFIREKLIEITNPSYLMSLPDKD